MATPQNPAQPGYPPQYPTPPAKRPTLWIALAAVATVAAIGFAIWAFSEHSSANDTTAKLSASKAQLAQLQADIAKDTAKEKSVIKTANQIEQAQLDEYRHTRRVLSRTKKTVAQQRVTIAKEKEDVRAAQQQLDEAGTRDAKLQAQLNLTQQKLDVALACQRGTVSAIDSVFAAPTAKAGVNRLTSELSSLAKDCQENVGT